MTWQTFKRPLVCPTCGQQGEFVYQQAAGAYDSGPMTFQGLSPGFSFKDTGFASSSTVTCLKCHTIVFGPDRDGTTSSSKGPEAAD
jgi:hypothetical protein